MKYKLVKRRPIKRMYHSYDTWECYQSGMYNDRKREDAEPYIEMAIRLLRDLDRLETNMTESCREWFHSSQTHLTSRNSNRQAVLGRFACCYAHGITEVETRQAWQFLTDEERIAANKVADKVILIWEGWHYEYEDSIRDERKTSSERKN